jgi:hypothetical protein
VFEPAIWRLVGVVDDTKLTWSVPVGGPDHLDQGESVEFITGDPFVVESQDADHPFLLVQYMSSSHWQPGLGGYGDPDMVIGVPPAQFLREYVFFADVTYPETNLVVVRTKVDGAFADVYLDCAGELSGWKPVGDDYEYTRVDLSTGDFQPVGLCTPGRRHMRSSRPFGLWVWGWGTPNTKKFSAYVSYGYPGGMALQSINEVHPPK